MTATAQFDALADSLVGERINYVWRGYGSAVFLELGQLTPWTRLDGSLGRPEVGQVTLGVGWSWRIQDDRSILCGSWSDEELWEPSLARLRGAIVQGCSLFGSLPEVELTTRRGLQFLSFSTTDGQPGWHIVDRRQHPALWFTVREGRLHVGDGS